MKVLIADRIAQQGIDVLLKAGLVVDVKPGLTESELIGCIPGYDGLIIRSATRVTEAVLCAADRLKVVGRAGAGVDNIDVGAATQRGILVMNTPGGNSVSVAEHTLGLMLALVRQLIEANQSMKGGRWEKGRFTGRELKGKVLGLIGLGKVGQEVARRAGPLGMKVIAYDPFISERVAQDLDVHLVMLDELFQCSDIISLHATLNEQTRAIINRRSLRQMKDGVLIINCSRGELVDEQALLEGIKAGKVGGAGLDVFVGEPSPMRELVEHPHVIATPHIAASTQEAQEQVGIDIAEQVRDYLQAGQIKNAVNFPAIQPEEAQKLRVFCELGKKLGQFIAQMSDRRVHEIGIRYYGKVNELNTYPISNAILSGVLEPALGEEVNIINARRVAEERRLIVTETKSGRARSLSNVISVQLRDEQGGVDWVEGAVFKQNHLRLVTIDGIDLEVPLSRFMLLMHNRDVPGVIGRIGTILGAANVNIANFALGRRADAPLAIGVLTVDSEIDESVLSQIQQSSGITKVRFINLG